MKRSIHIEAPVETVFGSFMDPARFWDLMPIHTHLDDVKVTKEGVGTYTSWHGKFAGMPFRGFDVYTDVVPQRHITERSSNTMAGTWNYDFEREGSGTKLTMEHHPESFWRAPLLSNVMEMVTERMTDTVMARLKDAIETQGTKSAATGAR